MSACAPLPAVKRIVAGLAISGALQTVAFANAGVSPGPPVAVASIVEFHDGPGGTHLIFDHLSTSAHAFSRAGDHLFIRARDGGTILSRCPEGVRRSTRMRLIRGGIDLRLPRHTVMTTTDSDDSVAIDILLGPSAPAVAKPDKPITQGTVAAPDSPLGSLPAPFIVLSSDAPESDKNRGVAAPPSGLAPGDRPDRSREASPRSGPVDAGSARLSDPSSPLAFEHGAGLAVRRRPGVTEIIFDQPGTVDEAAFRAGPGMSRAEIIRLPDALVIRVPTPSGAAIVPAMDRGGWRFGWGRMPDTRPSASPDADGEFVLPDPARSIVIRDPDAGGLLLVGTTRSDRRAPVASRHSPLFDIEPSDYGVVVAPLSDDLELDRSAHGFRLTTERGSLHLVDADSEAIKAGLGSDALGLCGPARGDFDADLRAALRKDVGVPVRERLAPRLAIATSMISYGLGAEARAVLATAAAEDPGFAALDRARALRAIADLLSGHGGDPDDWVALQRVGSADSRFWSTLSPGAIVNDETHAPSRAGPGIIDCYRPSLRQRIAELQDQASGNASLPGGVGPVADAIGAAAQAEHLGHLAEARAVLDRLAHQRDLGQMAAGMLARTDFDVSHGAMQPAAAIAYLSAHTFDWRVSGTTVAALEATARYERLSGRYAAAIRTWQRVGLEAGVARTSGAAIRDILASLTDAAPGSAVPTGELLTAVDESRTELTAWPDLRKRLDAMLLDRMEAAALPRAAADLASRMIPDADPGVARERLGLRLVAMRLADGDVVGGRSAFDAIETPGDPAEAWHRALVAAALLEAEHRPGDEILAPLDGNRTADADRIRARIFERDGRWHEARAALLRLAGGLPDAGPLTADQAVLVLDLASVAIRDGDRAYAARLDRNLSPRLPDPTMRADLDRLAAPL